MLVAKGFRSVNRDQQFLLAPDMREWVPAEDPVWVVISVVESLDHTRLRELRKTGGPGRAAYDPVMLLTLLVWAWAQGQRSSRRIERLCARDVAFRIICAGDVPDHVTISRFRADCAPVVQELFAQVLVLCARVGMGRLGVVALDSVKIASNASIKANRTGEGMRKAAAELAAAEAARRAAAAAAAEHAATDAAEDSLFGAGKQGDQVPADLVDPSTRAQRIARALAELEAENARRTAPARARAKRRGEQAARRAGQLEAYERHREATSRSPMGSPPTEIRVEVLTANLAAVRARHQSRIDRWDNAVVRKGRRPGPVADNAMVKRTQAFLDRAIADRAAVEANPAQVNPAAAHKNPNTNTNGNRKGKDWGGEPKRNITDPESRLMPLRGGGWLQGYNCQALTSGDGLIIATDVGNNPADATAFASMMAKADAVSGVFIAARPVQVPDTGIGTLLADTGYLSEANLQVPGPDRLVAVGKTRAVTAAATQDPATGPAPAGTSEVEKMAHRLRTPEGHQLYKQRAHIAETPFGHAKHNLGFRRFTSRGITRATAEFAFHALVHNLFKAIGTGHLTPTTC